MRFSALATGLFAALAAAASTSNPFIQPTAGASFKAGETESLQWTPSTSGTVSLRLQWGALTTATEGIAIATSIDNTGTFSWTVPANIPVESDYFIRIASDDDATEVNYSARFVITGVSGSASSVTASASTSFSSAASTTLVTSTSTSTSTTSTSSSSTSSSSSSSSTSTPASTTKTTVKTTATPSPTVASTPTSSPASSTATTTSPSASATTSVPNINGGESVRVPSLLMGAVGLGAFVML